MSRMSMSFGRAPRVARALFHEYGRACLIFWGILLAIVALLSVTRATALPEGLSDDVWGSAVRSSSRIFLLVIGILATTASLPVYVAHGVTRREYVAGAGLFAVLVGALFAVVVLAGYLIQWAIGFGQVVVRDPAPVLVFYELLAPWVHEGRYFTEQPLPLLALHEALLFAVWYLTGALIGAGFYRHVAAGLLTIPLAAAWMLAAESAGGETLAQIFAWAMPAAHLASTALQLGMALAGWLVTYGILRQVAIRSSQG